MKRHVALLSTVLLVVAGCSPDSPGELAAAPPLADGSSRQLAFETRNDTLFVIAGATGATLQVFAPDEAAFLRGLVPALDQARKVSRQDPAEPYLLHRRADGEYVLLDPLTDSQIDVPAFGKDAVSVFHELWGMLPEAMP